MPTKLQKIKARLGCLPERVFLLWGEKAPTPPQSSRPDKVGTKYQTKCVERSLSVTRKHSLPTTNDRNKVKILEKISRQARNDVRGGTLGRNDLGQNDK